MNYLKKRKKKTLLLRFALFQKIKSKQKEKPTRKIIISPSFFTFYKFLSLNVYNIQNLYTFADNKNTFNILQIF